MNILYVMYESFKSNSAIHTHNFANSLIEAGHECIIAVPKKKETVTTCIGGDILYTPLNFSEAFNCDSVYANGKGPDIIHAWTPRENVRNQCLKLKEKYPECKLIVHLEDNEETLLEIDTGISIKKFDLLPDEEIAKIVPPKRSHPKLYKEFLKNADGVTMIMDTLIDFIPDNKPHMILWPIIDATRFYPQEQDKRLRAGLGIEENETVICYTGNVHSANSREVRSLYLAIALANREGFKSRLIRTGKDYCKFLGEDDTWARQHAIELGVIESKQIPSLLALSDILIQPGKPDIFNDYRLPSKIPEFLSMGKPVALPNTNIGKYLTDKEEALIFKKGDSLEILEAMRLIKTDSYLAQTLSKGGRKFAIKMFDKQTITKNLDRFYITISKTGHNAHGSFLRKIFNVWR